MINVKKKFHDFTYCKQSLNNKTCDICDKNNYFDEDGICVPSKYCSKSKDLTCIKCIEGYNLTIENNVCTFTENCLNGDKDLGMCMTCNDTFYLDGNDYICKTNLENNEFKHCTKSEEGKLSHVKMNIIWEKILNVLHQKIVLNLYMVLA